MSDIAFDRDFRPAHGEAVDVAPGVRRVTANNPGPFTFHGTNSYIVGHGRVAIIDPGPDDAAHFAALIAATRGETVSHILVTHTHRDHSGGLPRLRETTGGAAYGGGPHRPARPLRAGEVNLLDAAADTAFVPDVMLGDGAAVEGPGWTLRAVTTPGHTANHLAFALGGPEILFSGDHVMAWSTTIVAPPDGAMADYMASLEKLLSRPERHYFPGHGGPVEDASAYVRGLIAHRRLREQAILARLAAGDATIPAITAAVYRDTDPSLHGAAALSVFAQLEWLVERSAVVADGAPTLAARYRLRSP